MQDGVNQEVDTVTKLETVRAEALKELEDAEARVVRLRKALGIEPESLSYRMMSGAASPEAEFPRAKEFVPIPTVTRTRSPAPQAARPARRGKGARLRRRSPEQIAELLGKIVTLVKRKGLRAEEIRVKLDLQAKEMPRVLQEGIRTKALRKAGSKRATVYTAA